MLRQRNKKTSLTIASLILATLLIGGTVYAVTTGFFSETPQPGGPTEEDKATQRDAELERKRQFIEATKDTETPGVNPEIPTSSDSIDILPKQDAGTITITTKLRGYSAGTCHLEMTDGSSVISETADIIYQPEFSTCAGFSILKSRLHSGDWSITLHVTPTGGSEISKTVTYSVR